MGDSVGSIMWFLDNNGPNARALASANGNGEVGNYTAQVSVQNKLIIYYCLIG